MKDSEINELKSELPERKDELPKKKDELPEKKEEGLTSEENKSKDVDIQFDFTVPTGGEQLRI